MSYDQLNTLKINIPKDNRNRSTWPPAYGSATGLAIVKAAQRHDGPLIIITEDTPHANQLEYEIQFFLDHSDEIPIYSFPDRETLPYDLFSPHQDIISQRLETLYHLGALKKGIVIAPASTLMHRLPPVSYLAANSLILEQGQILDVEQMRLQLEQHGYQHVSQVMEHGEYTTRGSILDIYPMGCANPLRIELFDNEIDTIRTFDPETQRSIEQVSQVRTLPAREFPLNNDAIAQFRQRFRDVFTSDPKRSTIYNDVSSGLAPAGIEYYLPLFFDSTATIFDYLAESTLIITASGLERAADQFRHETHNRYEQRRYDIERPILEPSQIILQTNELFNQIKRFCRINLSTENDTENKTRLLQCVTPPNLPINARATQPLTNLLTFVKDFQGGRILIAAETTGRRETLLELLNSHALHPKHYQNWLDFLNGDAPLGITVAPLDQGLLLEKPKLAVITEPQLFGEQAMQRRRRKSRNQNMDAVVRDLAELHHGAPVVHEEHGVGRFVGLQILTMDNLSTEFVTLEYAGKDKLYVPVSSLHLISRYSGAAPEKAPLHRLGNDRWEKAKEKAAKKVLDVAAGLLDIYARRAAQQGYAFANSSSQYATFATSFPFEETPDQKLAIEAVKSDMLSDKPMDRLICGDVGFGKTEVAMRATFIAANDGAQVAILVPTTLLAQQHYQTFCDRFADWPFRVEVLSRFRSKKETDTILAGLENGTVDIVIGTHKLLQKSVKFKNLGLFILDEEHRFGVRQKEQLKSIRANIDVLTLSATPIPRTLNMAVSALRDLSIIATPPSRRLAVKTFVQPWNDATLQEACLREIKRGGQVFFLHNEVESIDRIARQLEELIPEAKVRVGHGQMSERELERVMLDFYHHRFNILVCTTIIETGIDIPTANTIIINKANRFGLAQLYQLRGRVGRSHHKAYAYLLVPPKDGMTKDAQKRLDALASIEELGAGFTLAVHDLEIRGAGELLGDEQSGQMQEIGFTLYTELLDRAVNALKKGEQPNLEEHLDPFAEIDLNIPALIPDDYLPDVHSRLILYKRIANTSDQNELRELQVEMIDRFGLLPTAAKNLFAVSSLKILARPLGIKKVDGGPKGGRIVFDPNPNIDPMQIIRLIQKQPEKYKLDGENKLRYVIEQPESHQRIAAIQELIQLLSKPK
ncbi:Transcription-repair coupling factor [hydrothermal vent metagenome]|uniref:Transcription-repair coupling factor n=1 Tax=hydrothermal vent metagenome TaxID=652676 RepID=A0A3B0ZM13_9ZZZZ